MAKPLDDMINRLLRALMHGMKSISTKDTEAKGQTASVSTERLIPEFFMGI